MCTEVQESLGQGIGQRKEKLQCKKMLENLFYSRNSQESSVSDVNKQQKEYERDKRILRS